MLLFQTVLCHDDDDDDDDDDDENGILVLNERKCVHDFVSCEIGVELPRSAYLSIAHKGKFECAVGKSISSIFKRLRFNLKNGKKF